MSSKKFTKWIDKLNYSVCYEIARKYYLWKEGVINSFFDKRIFRLLIKRLFYLFVLIFRFNKYPHPNAFKGSISVIVKRIMGLASFSRAKTPSENDPLETITFPVFGKPKVSIIIAVYNQLPFTAQCIKSIIEHTHDISYEVIVVDDCSSDGTVNYIKSCENVSLIENDYNIGFLRSCNKAAKIAKGQYLCFLNNDTIVTSKWLNHLHNTFVYNMNVGLVGAKLVYPYGLLQEAGGLVNASGQPSNYGRWRNPDDFAYNYLRESDYCSGACMLVESQTFQCLGGFDEQFAPAYYEDTDLCFSVRNKVNKKVLYQPLCEIIHFEGISSGKAIEAGNVKHYQQLNADKFTKKWRNNFADSSSTDDFNDHVSKFELEKKKILIIDTNLPFYDKDSGSRRMYELIKIFLSLNFSVYFMPDSGKRQDVYYDELVTRGVKLIYEQLYVKSKMTLLEETLGLVQYVWISRPELNEKYGDILRLSKNVMWIYDTVDLHFLRLERALKIGAQTGISKKTVDELKNKELSLAKLADLTLVVTPAEAEILKENGVSNVAIVPNIHRKVTEKGEEFSMRKDLCFIGGYEHKPNVDAVIWLIKEIMPLVWDKIPEIKVNLLGSQPSAEVLALRSSKVLVPGYIKNVSTFFYTNRIFVAPLRYGAGMKGKIGQAMEYGLPIITTDIGAEGMGLTHQTDVLLANNSNSFAAAIVNLYSNEILWEKLSYNSQISIDRYSPEVVKGIIEKEFNRQPDKT